MKTLFRSRKYKILGGVCGGIAEYFNVDPILIRLLYLITAFLTPWAIAVYLIAWIAIPREVISI